MFNLEEYTTVRERVIEFWNRNPNGRIETEILEWSDKRFIVAARLYRNVEDTKPFSTGLAHEAITDRGVNKDFALENGATSAIGIACANANIGIEKHKASREEMSKVAPNHPALKAVRTEMKPAAQEVKEGDVDYWTTPIGANIKTVQAPVTLDAAMATVSAILGTGDAEAAPTCSHGSMIWQEGEKNGKSWARYKCSLSGHAGTAAECSPIWYNLTNEGKWSRQKARV